MFDRRLGSRPIDFRTVLAAVLIVLLIGALPTWPYSAGWGYYPSGGIRSGPTHNKELILLTSLRSHPLVPAGQTARACLTASVLAGLRVHSRLINRAADMPQFGSSRSAKSRSTKPAHLTSSALRAPSSRGMRAACPSRRSISCRPGPSGRCGRGRLGPIRSTVRGCAPSAPDWSRRADCHEPRGTSFVL